jgi:hypothetical protein
MDRDIDVWSHLVQDRVDDKTCMADGVRCLLLDLSFGIDQDKVRNLDQAEVHSIWIYTIVSKRPHNDDCARNWHTNPKEIRIHWVCNHVSLISEDITRCSCSLGSLTAKAHVASDAIRKSQLGEDPEGRCHLALGP